MSDGYAPCVCHNGVTWDTGELSEDGFCPQSESEDTAARASRMERMIRAGYTGPAREHD